MDTFVFGVGCSGTTMIYSLLQTVYARLYDENYISSYEPFIWDREKFNCPYQKAVKYFGRTSSLSIEGIYNHVKTPLFINSADKEGYINNEFFRYFSATQRASRPHLAKFIRANGRMSVFRALNPEAKMLLIIRNPVDNVNCAKYKFSFYGADFHPSDYPRLCEQLAAENKLILDKEKSQWGQRQAEYCHQMNTAAVEFARVDGNTKIIEYDCFIQDKATAVIEVCDFLGVINRLGLTEQLGRVTGPMTGSITLSQPEYEAILPYDLLYTRLTERAGVIRGLSTKNIQNHYGGNCASDDLDPAHMESTTNRLRQIIRLQKSKLRKFENGV